MIKQKTARAMLYDWHGGQRSATYAAASSGLIINFEELLREVNQISFTADRDKLTEYLLHQQSKRRLLTRGHILCLALPWAN
jgi:hypothetical protein